MEGNSRVVHHCQYQDPVKDHVITELHDHSLNHMITHHYHDIMLSMVMEIFHQFRQFSKVIFIVGEVKMISHVINVIPLSILKYTRIMSQLLGNIFSSKWCYLRYLQFPHSLHNSSCIISRLVTPATQVETKCPIWWEIRMPNQLIETTQVQSTIQKYQMPTSLYCCTTSAGLGPRKKYISRIPPSVRMVSPGAGWST